MPSCPRALVTACGHEGTAVSVQPYPNPVASIDSSHNTINREESAWIASNIGYATR